MKKIKNKIATLLVAIAMLFIASASAQPKKSTVARTELQAKIKKLAEQIKTATTNKARLQRERDMLLRKLKEVTASKRTKAAEPARKATPKI